MKVLVDAVLFQTSPEGSAASALYHQVLRELVGIAQAKGIALAVLDRGGRPSHDTAEVIPFPSYHAADAVADAILLQRIAECVGAGALVSTALTAPTLLPTVHLVCGVEEAVPDRGATCGLTEAEIAVACSSALVCASEGAADALRSRFPRHRSRIRAVRRSAVDERSQERLIAETVADAVIGAAPPFGDPDLARRFVALRRLQAAFEVSNG